MMTPKRPDAGDPLSRGRDTWNAVERVKIVKKPWRMSGATVRGVLLIKGEAARGVRRLGGGSIATRHRNRGEVGERRVKISKVEARRKVREEEEESTRVRTAAPGTRAR